MRWNIVFDPKLEDLNDILPYFIEVEAFKKSVLKLPVPPTLAKRVNQINIVRQIKGTTGIEGNTLSEDEIYTVIEKKEKQKSGKNVEEQEVINAQKVIEFIRNFPKEENGLITEEFIRGLHRINTDQCNYKDSIPGEYRRHQNVVGDFTPPRPEEVPDLMRQFIQLINSPRVINRYGPLVRAIMAHFYLITIHPFGDGNGRTSRAVEAFILYHAGYNVRGFYSLANYYYKNRSQYVEELQKARFEFNGKLTNFIKFSLEGFIEELQGVQDQIIEFYTRLSYESYLGELLQEGEINSRVYNLLLYMTQAHSEMNINDFRTRKNPIIASLYNKIKSDKTIVRDYKTMLTKKLITNDNGKLKPNLEVMKQFLI